MTNVTLYTIGHSTHPIGEFIKILQAYGIKEVVDIRTIPKSRHNPQFDEDALRTVLHNHHIGYRHMKGLAGFAIPQKNQLILPGEIHHFEVLRIICKQKSFQKALQSYYRSPLKK